VRAQLDRARKDPDIKAVVLRIDSPGGDVTASDHIHHDLLAFRRETNRPVIAFFGDTAASGAYYVAQAADAIVASPTTTTGSIGVMALFFDVHQLAQKVGVRFQAITSGELKDLGSPFREMTAQERAHLKGLIDSVHERFLDVVAEGRKRAGLTRDQVAALADGRLFTAQGARAARLVDQIGYLDDALQAAAAAASLDEPCLVAYQRKGLGGAPATVYSALRVAGQGAGAASDEALVEAVRRLAPRRGPVLRYLWSPLLGAQ
jgi:protease-4